MPHFRSASLTDIHFILSGNQIIDQKSYDHEPPNPLTVDRLKSDVFSDKPRCYIDVAEMDGQLAGFIMYSFCYFASEGEGIWVTNFYIDPFCRKKRLGKLFVQYMKDKYPHSSGIYGAISRGNNIARHFFTGMGATRYDDYIIYGFEGEPE